MKTVFSVIVILVGMSLVSIFLVAAPPSQNEPDRAEDAATLAAMETAAKESDMPVAFFGKVLDQNGKAVEGVDIYMGGKVGKEAHLGTCVTKGIPCEDLQPVLQDLLVEHFGAKPKQEVLVSI